MVYVPCRYRIPRVARARACSDVSMTATVRGLRECCDGRQRSRFTGTVQVAVRCDFCGDTFLPDAWNGRTCHTCAARRFDGHDGAPDQGAMTWSEYRHGLNRWRWYLRNCALLLGRLFRMVELVSPSRRDRLAVGHVLDAIGLHHATTGYASPARTRASGSRTSRSCLSCPGPNPTRARAREVTFP